MQNPALFFQRRAACARRTSAAPFAAASSASTLVAATGTGYADARRYLREAGDQTTIALVMLIAGVDAETPAAALDENHGVAAADEIGSLA